MLVRACVLGFMRVLVPVRVFGGYVRVPGTQ